MLTGKREVFLVSFIPLRLAISNQTERGVVACSNYFPHRPSGLRKRWLSIAH